MSDCLGETIVIIPTYNEADTIGGILAQLLDLGYQVFVVDDGSDATPDICRAVGVPFTHRDKKGGLGSAIKLGVERAIEMGAARVVVMDAGGNHLPAAIPLLERACWDGADVAIASRFKNYYVYRGWRTTLSRCAAILMSPLLGRAVSDVTASFRCYRIDSRLQIALMATRANGHAFQFEVLTRLAWGGAKVVEVPATYRLVGKSTLRLKTVVEAASTYLRLWKEKGQRK